MRVVLGLVIARHDEDAAAEADHVDRRAVKPGQHGPGDHLVHAAQRRLAAAEVEHPVERTEQRVEFVGG